MSHKRTVGPGTKASRTGGQRKRQEITEPDSVAQALASLDELKPGTRKAKHVIALFKSWLRDESGYDEEAWPELKQALNQQRRRVGARSLFDA